MLFQYSTLQRSSTPYITDVLVLPLSTFFSIIIMPVLTCYVPKSKCSAGLAVGRLPRAREVQSSKSGAAGNAPVFFLLGGDVAWPGARLPRGLTSQ